MRDFQCFEQSSLKRNYDFTEVPMATYYKQPGVHTKNFRPISQQRIALIQFVCNKARLTISKELRQKKVLK